MKKEDKSDLLDNEEEVTVKYDYWKRDQDKKYEEKYKPQKLDEVKIENEDLIKKNSSSSVWNTAGTWYYFA